jgi:hypothetical protein
MMLKLPVFKYPVFKRLSSKLPIDLISNSGIPLVILVASLVIDIVGADSPARMSALWLTNVAEQPPAVSNFAIP